MSLPPAERLALRAVAAVLPFRTNTFVVDELIDWSAVPDDPIFRLTFPQAEMLPEPDLKQMAELLARDAPKADVLRAAHEIRMKLNPHPSGQLDANVPVHEGRRLTHRPPAQVPGNGADLPAPGPDLPRLLHVLLPLAPVRRRVRPAHRHRRHR
ncbi:hypothetical protein ABZT42_41145, partial [Streptomyces mirabilis]